MVCLKLITLELITDDGEENSFCSPAPPWTVVLPKKSKFNDLIPQRLVQVKIVKHFVDLMWVSYKLLSNFQSEKKLFKCLSQTLKF